MNQNPTSNFQESRSGSNSPCSVPSHAGLCVTVISTTPEGTIAALNEATRLATDLEAHITLLKLEKVPLRFPLDQPPVSLDIVTKKQCSLVLQSSAREEKVTVRVCLCRDRDLNLSRILRRGALIVIGGERRWWKSREERLEQALFELGHHVVFAEVGQNAKWSLRDAFTPSLETRSSQLHKRADRGEVFPRRGGLQ